MSDKKTKVSVLGPRGRRRLGLGRDGNYKDPGADRVGYLGGQAKEQNLLKQEGFGVFPKDWLERCNTQPKEKKTSRFVLPNPRDPTQDVTTWEAAKLATPKKMATQPTYHCFNPFTEATPFGDGQPLPR